MSSRRSHLHKYIISILLDGEEEVSGYDIYKTLADKGLKVWPNNVYTTLTQMEKSGLLRGRWLDNPNGKGAKKHLYSLGKKGREEFQILLKESLDLLMTSFIHSNTSTLQDLTEHIEAAEAFLSVHGIQASATKGAIIVIAIPQRDPLLCFPASIYSLSDVLPKCSIYVVKPPGLEFSTQRKNLTFVDGWRHDIPLKDNFADLLFLEGFPKDVPIRETLSECLRVLNKGGTLCIQISNVMIEEKRPQYVSFAEYVSKLFYDLGEQDRTISLEEVKRSLSRHFQKINENLAYGNLVLWCQGFGLRTKVEEESKMPSPSPLKQRV